jgi:hypothetical protein
MNANEIEEALIGEGASVKTMLRAAIRLRLERVSPKAKAMFDKCLRPGETLEDVEEDRLRSLHALCQRTALSTKAPAGDAEGSR